ncbi:hypothetical protein, partial [Deinococcus sp.]|uniref:delta-60 repeat domain-containing protein n=1 Tax=Deinococcus sp. TaxID=47478 RepID=UPI002869879F
TTLSATARDADGQVVPNAALTWKSSALTVATVAAGVVTGKGAGSAEVTASAGSVTSAPATVTVTEAAPAASYTLAVSADRLPVITGPSGSLSVTVTRDAGFTDAVTVALNGLLSGASAPSVTIPAGQASATITVSAAASAPHSQPTAVTLKGTAGTQSVSKTITVTVRGPAGSLDTTFGAGGISKTPIGQDSDYGYAAAVQPDGKVILVGSVKGPTFEDFGIARFTRDGALDPTFGTGGKVVVDFAGAPDIARAVAVQADGKIVVAGGTNVTGDAERFGLLRLSAGGSLDTTFGTGGKLTTAFTGSGGDRASALLIQPDGKIVAGGQASFFRTSADSGVDFAVARYLPSGALDSSFGTAGQVTTAMSTYGGSDKIFALALQGDRIVAAGGDIFQVARYTAAGVLDTTFGTGGRVNTVFPGSSGATSVQVDAQQRLVVGGQEQMNTAVVRLTENGALDSSFGSGGKTVLKLNPSNWNVTTGVALQTDGKIVTGNWVYEGNTSNDNFAVTRLNANGQVDAAFGTNGTTITKGAANTRSTARAALLQPDDRIPATRILLAGDSNYDFTLTRYWP